MKTNLKKETLLTQKELKKVLHYDPETGKFTWIVDASRRINKGSIAGCVHPMGYVQIKINGVAYRGHRLAFLYMMGNFPPDQVDHINQVKDDNRWENLRLCTKQENMFNTPMYKNNISGYKGVFKRGKKWKAKIRINGKYKCLGSFSTPEIASKVYEGHAKKLFGEFANVNQQEGL